MQPAEIAIRAYVPSKEPTFSQHEDQSHFDRVLVFDTETTTDRHQNLKFGSFKIYDHGRQNHQGIFYNLGSIDPKELEILEAYCKVHRIGLMSVSEFVDNVFLPEVYDLKTLCIGFNLPFDLSRIARGFGYARGGGKKGGFSFILTENKKRPRLVIKHIDSAKSFIRFGSSIDRDKRKLGFKGNFLDLHTLVHALTGESHSLESACKLFGADVAKGQVEKHGKITREYIDYNRKDVDATYSLYRKAMEEFEMYGLDISVTRVYSSASIGKAYLKMMGIKSFQAKNNNGRISNEVLGYVTTTYIGGRSEVKIRKQPNLVTLLDFTSMYPTMCILMGLWDFIICDHVETQECTEEIVELVKNITLDDFRRKETLAKLNVIVQVEANEDLMPIRCKFGNKQTYNIADCYITTSNGIRPLYTLADVINCKLRTGNTPKIVRAIRFVAVGRQQGLQPITLFGKTIDPNCDNFFKAVIEHRKQLQQQQKECGQESEKALLDKKQKGVKTVANATSYGIFMEINTQEQEADLIAYGLVTTQCHVSKIEQFGKQSNPLVATFITSGARLVLGIVEALLARHEAVHAFCDTDSMAVPPQYTKEVQEFFNGLNPYSFDAPMFKVEEYEDERKHKHPLENIWFYGISAKRYALYKLDSVTGKMEILKASSHGLGHLMNPFAKKDDDDWHKKVWLGILNLHYGLISADSLNEKYGCVFALAHLTISTPQIMKRFGHLNNDKPYNKQIKPFNFCIIGIGNIVDEKTRKPVRPLAPYRRNSQECPYDVFIDYNTGNELKGLQYWKPFSDVFWNYINHPEAKFDGDVGVLSRKHVIVGSVVQIGKESNNLEQAEVLGVQEDDYVRYDSSLEQIMAHKEKILQAEPKDVKKFRIVRQTLFDIKRAIIAGDIRRLKVKTITRLLEFVAS